MVERAGERAARLAAALRENLKRRKAQARDGARQVPPADPDPVGAAPAKAGAIPETGSIAPAPVKAGPVAAGAVTPPPVGPR